MKDLQGKSEWAMKMFDSVPKLSHPGISEDNIFSFPGVFDECVGAMSAPVPNNESTTFHGKYCLMGLHPMAKNTLNKELNPLDIYQTG